ncbi:hypothetical protein [Cryptosporidium parvum Iowa II]|uniref:Uncharacterized protein n=3 Tax=Cryptosporidium parvum TaxID=5807 RepID=Q5CTK9_CRYPI|nr:hypothetical protein [Cryptosporidium parvum Iowa II]EAK88744.1 hypothetical protein cgd2_2580 [Cryptosporidium parvum Iowa II]QOY42972.1 Uncharacterized protein CPATCC_0028200 [Cryptosporidium parvum]WKS76556.1 hypothetical protein CPCDC_2g2580 [Cryptosporidium sp. 43IA8]WRK31049.1 Uncharacterized protein cpbgf_2002590 [Cryptosporidium parvum]|eukprot:QOY42972.1 hypothetical protein CPATCC_000668 [Cryptosporidium parvum]
MKFKCKKDYLSIIFLWICFFSRNEIFVRSNNYYLGENYDSPFTKDEPNPLINHLNYVPFYGMTGISPGYENPAMIPMDPNQFNQPVTSLGKQLASELKSIQLGNGHLVPDINVNLESRASLGQDILKVKKINPKKKIKSKSKSETSERKPLINSSSLISYREYFLPVPEEVGKGVKLNESCLFSPTPMKISKKDSYWRKTDDSKAVNRFEVSSPVFTDENPFRTSSECLNLFDEAFNAYRKKELLISPERFVSLTRQVAMQLRDSLLNFKYVVSTEDSCLAMRMMLFLPHQLRNTLNCKSAIIASLRDPEEITNFELLDQLDENTESKFKDISFVCKNTFKFNEPNSSLISTQIFKPSEMAKFFRLDLTVKNLQFFHRLSIPHRKAALKVQESYQKHTKDILLYDIAASIIFLLNELHATDQSIEQCSVIVFACVSMQNGETSNLNQMTAEQICKELGIELILKKHNVKYSSLIFFQLLKKQTHDKSIFGRVSTSSYTLPSGKIFLPYSKYGYPKISSNLEIWASVGKVFSDGTVSSFIIPACTGLPASEFNRFIFLNTMIERYLTISGLGQFKLTVEDICMIAKYYLAYKKHLRNEMGNQISTEDTIPLAIFKVAQRLNLDIFTISACREIYREFSEEEEAMLKKTVGNRKEDKLESIYSKPPFSYNSNIILRHQPKINEKQYANTWCLFQKDDACSHLKHFVLNRMVLFVAYVLEFWRKSRTSEKMPFKSITEICIGFSGDYLNFRPKASDFKLFTEDWLFQKDEQTLYSNTLDLLWNNFLIFENSAFPKNSEETESDYLQRIYNNALVPEPLFVHDWKNIELPIRMDIAEFTKLLPHVQKSVEIFSTLDDITLNHVTLVRAFLESFFEETYQFPVIISEKDILLLLERRELEKKPLDELFFEIMSSKSDWSWIKHETSSHAILRLLEYLKTVKKSVEESIKRTPTKSDIYSAPRAVLAHGKWLIKAPYPVFYPSTPLQKRALHGLPKFLINKARYIQAYFINAFDRVLQFDLSLRLADIVYSLTNCAGDDKKLVELLRERISIQNGQDFVNDNVVSEIYNSCMSFSFYKYLLKGALSEEQAFAAPRVFYKPKFGWRFFPPNVPDFSRLLVLSKAFKVESGNNEFDRDPHKLLDETNSNEIVVRPYTWKTLKGIYEQKKLEIWQLNRAISMCAYFNHWISYKFSTKNSRDLQVSNCINAIYRLKSINKSQSQSEISQVFLRYLGVPFIKENDFNEMLSAFTSFECVGKPNSMSTRQWLMNLYRIPQIQENNKNSLSEEFESLRFHIPPVFGEQKTIFEHGQPQITSINADIPEIYIPMDLDSDSLNNLRELFEKFTYRYLSRVGIMVETELEALNFSMVDVFKIARDRKLSFSEALQQHVSDIGGNIQKNVFKKLSAAFFRFILLKFASSNEEPFVQILRRISISRVITDVGKLPFDIPLGIVSGKLDLDLPYNSHSFGEVNFARLVVAYMNEYLIELFDLRNKILSDGTVEKNVLKEFPGFVKENCVAKSMDVIRKGGIDLQNALDQSCSSELSWMSMKVLRMLVSGLMTYCKLNFRGFPIEKNGRSILDFSRENLNSPIVLFDKYFKTWTMQNARKNTREGEDFGSKFSTLESIGIVDQMTGTIISSNFNFCSEMNTSQINRLLIKLQYYKHCISENAISNIEVDRLLDLNIWCLALRQKVPDMKKTYSNMLFTYFGIRGAVKESFEILEDSFEFVEESLLGKNSLVSIRQWAQDFYSSHSKPFSQFNSLVKSDKLFCPRVITEDELHQFQIVQKDNIFNRVEAFQGFSEIFLREKYGIIFESRPIIAALLVDGFSIIKPSNSNIALIRSMIPIASEEIVNSLIGAFNSFEANLLKGGLTSLQDLYKNPICERSQGNWHFHVELETINRADVLINSKLIFSELEINRFQNIVAFLNTALNFKYSEKMLGSYISFKHIATLFKAEIDLSSFAHIINYFHRTLQDDLSFSPWLTVKALKGIFQSFISWERIEIFKVSPTHSKNFGLVVSSADMAKYNNSPVGLINGKWHWYTWCKRPDFNLIHREVLGDEVVHVLTPQERSLYGIPRIKHKFEIATLFIQYFLQDVLNILIPFKPDVTMKIFKGETNLSPDSVEFLRKIWEHYKNSFIYKGSLPKHDLFHNPIINVVNKQRFFPAAAIPRFDNFDTTLIPPSLIEIENLYPGIVLGSKFEINRLITICAFINLSFEIFIDDSTEKDDIITPIGLYDILKDKMNILIIEKQDEITGLFRQWQFYSGSQEKASHLKITLLNYNNFEKSMLDRGWDFSKLYRKPIVFSVQNGYKMNFNLKSYIPKVKNRM